MQPVNDSSDSQLNDIIFSQIAGAIAEQGYCILPNALPEQLAADLAFEAMSTPDSEFDVAGIGRGIDKTLNAFVRQDQIRWIDGQSQAQQQWLAWTNQLQSFLNRRLFLGLFSFESHFSHYGPGDFYKRHVDAFAGKTSRVLTVVAYLNSGWTASDGGELVLYQNFDDQTGIRVTPLLGSLVVFLSEDFPHEVLAANRDRYAIAGWFRVNASIDGVIDPPR